MQTCSTKSMRYRGHIDCETALDVQQQVRHTRSAEVGGAVLCRTTGLSSDGGVLVQIHNERITPAWFNNKRKTVVVEHPVEMYFPPSCFIQNFPPKFNGW